VAHGILLDSESMVLLGLSSAGIPAVYAETLRHARVRD